jgi:hypothetical protein
MRKSLTAKILIGLTAAVGGIVLLSRRAAAAPPPPPTVLPYPEDPPNYNNNMSNVYPPVIVDQWLEDWEVPTKYYPFWKSVTVDLDDTITPAAQTYQGAKLIQDDRNGVMLV